MNGFGILQARIHQRRRIQKPGTQVSDRMSSVSFIARNLPCRGQCGNLQSQSNQRPPVLAEIVRIREAVALDVRPAGIYGVGPPVISLREVIVPAAGTARSGIRSDRNRVLFPVSVGGVEYPVSIYGL